MRVPAILLLLCSVAGAADLADTPIVGRDGKPAPVAVPVGTLCVFWADTDGARAAWALAGDTQDVCDIADAVVTLPDGKPVMRRRVTFASPVPGRFVFAVGLVRQLEAGATEQCVKFHVIDVGGDGPGPGPTPGLAERCKAAFVGPDARADARKFSAIVSAVVTSLPTIETDKGVFDALAAAERATGWVTGRYPKLADVLRELPTVTEQPVPLTAATRAAFDRLLRAIMAGAEEAGK